MSNIVARQLGLSRDDDWNSIWSTPDAVDELNLSLCVYIESEPVATPVSFVEWREWQVFGLSSGLVQVARDDVLCFVLIGHDEGVSVVGVWILPNRSSRNNPWRDPKSLLVSLDENALACFWELETGVCLNKLECIGNSVSSCCLLEERFLCLMNQDDPFRIHVVDVFAESVAYIVSGFAFRKVSPIHLNGGRNSISPFKENGDLMLSGRKGYLAIETLDRGIIFFDIVSRRFVMDSIPEGEFGRGYEAHSVVDPHLVAQLSSIESKLAAAKIDVGVDENEVLKNRYARHDFRFTVEKNNSVSRLWETDLYAILSNTNELSLMHIGELELKPESENKDAGLEANDRPNNQWVTSGVLADYLQSCSASNEPVFAVGHGIIYAARKFRSELLLFDFFPDSQSATFRMLLPLEMLNIDEIAISPYADPIENTDIDSKHSLICLMDKTFRHELVVLSDLKETCRFSFASVIDNSIRSASVSWISRYSLALGPLEFNMLSNSVSRVRGSAYNKSYNEEIYQRGIESMYSAKTATIKESSQPSLASLGDISAFPGVDMLGDLKRDSHSIPSIKSMDIKRITSAAELWSVSVRHATSRSKSLMSLVSLFMQWGIDEKFDADIQASLGIAPPAHSRYRLLLDSLPSKRMYSLLADSERRWQVDPRFTALQTVGMVSLFVGLMSVESNNEPETSSISALVSHYGIVYPDYFMSKKQYIFPSADILANLVLSKKEPDHLKISSRLLLQYSIERMPVENRMNCQKLLIDRVRLSNGKDKAAVVIMGMVGCIKPRDISLEAARQVTKALCGLVIGSTNSIEEKAIAAELLARGLTLYCHHFGDNLPEIIIALILQHSKENIGDNNLEKKSDGEESSSAKLACQQALNEIGAAAPEVFLDCVEKVTMQDGKHSIGLRALSTFVKRQPIAMLGHLSRVADIVVKTLNPSDIDRRKLCLKPSTAVLRLIVECYPMTAFHKDTQRFAIGTVDSVVLVYDMRTASIWRILEGHSGAVVAIDFEPKTGHYLVSYSAADCTIRVWNIGSGHSFFGLMKIKGKCVKIVNLPRLHLANPPSQSDLLRECSLKGTSLLIREDSSRVDLRQYSLVDV